MKSRRIASIVTVTFILVSARTNCLAEEAGRWHSDLDEARTIARSSGRPMVILVTSQNCRYCLKMEQETLNDAAINRQLDAEFVAVRVNASQQRRVARRLGASSFPTTIFIESNSRTQNMVRGYIDPDQFRAHLERTAAARE